MCFTEGLGGEGRPDRWLRAVPGVSLSKLRCQRGLGVAGGRQGEDRKCSGFRYGAPQGTGEVLLRLRARKQGPVCSSFLQVWPGMGTHFPKPRQLRVRAR